MLPGAPVLADRPAMKSIKTPGHSQWSSAIPKTRKILEKKQMHTNRELLQNMYSDCYSGSKLKVPVEEAEHSMATTASR